MLLYTKTSQVRQEGRNAGCKVGRMDIRREGGLKRGGWKESRTESRKEGWKVGRKEVGSM